MKRLTFLCYLLGACCALAAPIPKPKESAFRSPGWEKPTDPDNDCKFIFGRESLTIEVPGKIHDIDWQGKRKTAPRLLRPVEGDFRVEVRVQWQRPALLSAGLIVLAEDGKWSMVRMELVRSELRGVAGDTRTFRNETGMGLSDRDVRDSSSSPKLATAYLRIDRQDGQCRGYSSKDGSNWYEHAHPDIKAFLRPAKVKVGMFVRSGSKSPVKVTFDQFKLTPLKKAK